MEALSLEPWAQTPLPFAWPPALYAWARRLPPSERHRILAALSANEAALLLRAGNDPESYFDRPAFSDPETVLERFCHHSWAFSVEYGMRAWAETCPADEAASLLEWAALVNNDPVLSNRHGQDWYISCFLVEEFVRKMPEPDRRLAVFVPFLSDRLSRQSHERDVDSLWSVADQIVDDLASLCPSRGEELPETDRWPWFLEQVRRGGFEEAADVLERMDEAAENSRRETRFGWPRTFWIQSHGPSNWKPVYQRLFNQEAEFASPIIGYADRLLPHDRLDLWEPIVKMEHGSLYRMRAFCRWVPPEYRDVLRDWGGVEDSEEAICAYYAYLHRAPRAVLEWAWAHRDTLTGWRIGILDRYLFAPAPLKPATLMYDSQDFEADFRLEDRLNTRGI